MTKNKFAQCAILLMMTIGFSCKKEERWAWPWKCATDNKCIRADFPKLEKDLAPTEHEFVCKLICDSKGMFWPLATRESSVSSKLVWLKIDTITFDLHNVSTPQDRAAREIITKISALFIEDIKKFCDNSLDAMNSYNLLNIKINVAEGATDVSWNTDESYTLDVKSHDSEKRTTVVINAVTIFGARHGLQTLSQMIATYSINKKCRLVMNHEASVEDIPVYQHRGLLIDTARRYLPINTIRRTLDGMGYCKLNVLHWHATDSQSFPFKLPRVPQLARNGAYSFDQVYTTDDIKQLINYGRLRGVHILLEIDAPAHAGLGWQTQPFTNINSSNTQVVCLNAQPYKPYCIQPPCGQLNPACPKMYNTLTELYKDIVDIYGQQTDVFHMGGDEVYMPCWKSSNDIKKYLASKGMGTSEEDMLSLWSEFQNKSTKIVDEILQNEKSTIILWSSHLTQSEKIGKYLDNKRYVIQTWVENNNTLPEELLQKGYRLIISTKNAWYLDHGFWGKTEYHGWKVVYDNRIPNNTDGVLGGEIAMWGEYADDNVIDGRIWPRTCAFSERLWSNPSTDANDALERILIQRERLVQSGIRAAPIQDQFCSHSPAYCLVP